MWQQARLLDNCDIDGRRVFNIGDTIWVKVGPPVEARRKGLGRRGKWGVTAGYDTNIQAPKERGGHPLIACTADKLELQPIFQDSVVLISYEALITRQRSLFQ